MGREQYFQNIYANQDESAPAHERLLYGSAEGYNLRVRQVLPAVQAHARKGQLIVDVGCGLGTYTEALAAAGHKVVGLDFMQQFVDECQSKAITKNLPVEYHQGSFGDVAEKFPGQVGLLYSVGVIQNIDDMDPVFKAMATSVQSGGTVIIETLNKWTVTRVFNLWDKTSQRFSTSKLRGLLKKNDFTDIELRPVFMLPNWLIGAYPILNFLSQIPVFKYASFWLAHDLLAIARKK